MSDDRDEVLAHLHHEELSILTRHWAWMRLLRAWKPLETGVTCAREERELEFADDRLTQITGVIGDDAVTRIVRDVECDFGKNVDPRDWLIFLVGSQKEKEEMSLRLCLAAEGSRTDLTGEEAEVVA